ncbi:MAG TPA: sigma-54 dependent transcriptional regulator [Polyangiaceae bacterium]|nr:sigma-54 dependent transcriptional regulator [Polyangiaceae bacterium]
MAKGLAASAVGRVTEWFKLPSVTQYSASGSGAIRVLVVDDDSVLVRALQRVLDLQGFEVDTALDGRSAVNRLESNEYDVMLLDLRMGSVDGMEVYASAQQGSPPATIIHSAHIDVRTAVMATRAGVQDVMQKPVPEEVLTARIRELAAQRRAARERSEPNAAPCALEESLLRLVGGSDKARELRDHVRRVAQFRDVPVLIQGPTGTGKELVAQAVHALTCPDEPFVSVNCAAVPEQLFESELFGHEAGAFTSARSSHVGLFEEAGRGTLFLDEVGEMPLALQAKLLRVLEIRQFRRVGGTRTRVFAARVVSATNRTLDSSLGGSMRADLFFRLAGYAIRTPPLSERISDVPELARHFLVEFGKRHQVGKTSLSPAALEALLAYHWPGNVRELRAVVENAAIVARDGLVQRSDIELALQARGSAAVSSESWQGPSVARVTLPNEPAAPATERSTGQSSDRLTRPASLPSLQRDLILRAFEDSQHNLSRAALDLGIPRSTLRARLKRYGVR